MDKQLEKFAEIVEDMILQLSYPGFDERSLKLGLPDSISKLPPRTYVEALKHESRVVRLASLRWFQERSGAARSHLDALIGCLADSDEWVRREAVHCLEKVDSLAEPLLVQLSELLFDSDPEVRKSTARALGKLGGKSEAVIAALQRAAEDENHEVRWKAQKALRKLGAYVA
jgi:HEAT repeat protein